MGKRDWRISDILKIVSTVVGLAVAIVVFIASRNFFASLVVGIFSVGACAMLIFIALLTAFAIKESWRTKQNPC